MNECSVYDFRYSASQFSSPDELRALLNGKTKKYVFQLEKGEETGYLHYQGRLSLIKKARKHPALKLFGDNPPQYFEPTSNPEYIKGDAFYQVKEQTRLEGPFRDDDVIPVKTKQMEMFFKWGLLPWQEQLIQTTSTFCLRKIDLVYDRTGNAGKSLFAEYYEYIGKAEEIPPFRLMDDIFAWVASRPIKPVYIVDMPRGMKKDKLGDFYSGLEVVKNGVCFDKRYTAKKLRFSRPRIIVFTNTLPNFNLMSKDRWSVWTITGNKLVKFLTEEDCI